MAFLTLSHGSACFAGAMLIKLLYLISEGNWFPNTLDKGNLENFFFVLASLMLLNILGLWRASWRYCNLNHFNAQRIRGNRCEETLLLTEKSLKFYGSTQGASSSIDLWETALWNWIWFSCETRYPLFSSSIEYFIRFTGKVNIKKSVLYLQWIIMILPINYDDF